MPGSLISAFLEVGVRENIPGIPGPCATRNLSYRVGGPWRGNVFRITDSLCRNAPLTPHKRPVWSCCVLLTGGLWFKGPVAGDWDDMTFMGRHCVGMDCTEAFLIHFPCMYTHPHPTRLRVFACMCVSLTSIITYTMCYVSTDSYKFIHIRTGTNQCPSLKSCNAPISNTWYNNWSNLDWNKTGSVGNDRSRPMLTSWHGNTPPHY